jgi:ribose 5-phosphate isomerase RpiB
MIYTARQIEQLHRANGHVTLPYHARLTPAGHDWVRARKLTIQYSDGEATDPSCNCPAPAGADIPRAPGSGTSGNFLWWCDGPSGPAKAALMSFSPKANLLPVERGADPSHTSAVVRQLAEEVKSGRITGGIITVGNGAAAMIMANRCPSLRAVLGTCLDSVDQAMLRLAVNILVLEHSHRTLNEMRNMIRRFVGGTRRLSPEIERQLEELRSCA